MIPPLNVRRLAPPTLAALAAGLALALLDIALSAAFGPHPRWLPPQLFSGSISQIGGRIARVEQMLNAHELSNSKLVAIIGASNVQQDFDPRLLTAADPRHRQWIIVAQGGNGIRDIEIYSRLLLDSAVKPALVILGIQDSMLHSNDEISSPVSPSHFASDIKRGQLCGALMDLSWIAQNRDSLIDCKTILTYRLTRDVQSALGLPMSVMFLPDVDPWSAPVYRYNPRIPDGALATQLAGLSPRLAPDQYESNDRQIAALARLVADLRHHGAKVLCVLTPESSPFRALEPPIVGRRFHQALAAIAATGEPLPVLDLRRSMNDDLFNDYVHLNLEGRRRFSAIFPQMAQLDMAQ